MARELNGVRIIGCGGIGSAAVPHILRYLSYTHKQADPLDVTLVDGDVVEAKNIERQGFAHSDCEVNKAEATVEKFGKEFSLLDISTFPQYVTTKNVGEVIHDGDLVFLGVDNYKSRKVISEYCETLDNVVLISGGNDWEDGNVQLFVKEKGKKLTANLGDYHDEIKNPKDKSPDELGCDQLVESFPQLLIMNLAVASMMLNVFYHVLTTEELDGTYGEVYLDIRKATAVPAKRRPLIEKMEGGV
jgi:molybdopterin/thiamine biosynthesis adenylyltransferase